MNAYAMKQYQTVSVHAQVTEADPHRLIQMLMEGGLQRLAQAKGAMEYGNVALKGELIGKAMGIIGGLRDALDKRSEEHTSELQSRPHLVCRLLLEKKKKTDC